MNAYDPEEPYIPIFDYKKMDTTKVNPIKNFLEVFLENEMQKCVDRFNKCICLRQSI